MKIKKRSPSAREKEGEWKSEGGGGVQGKREEKGKTARKDINY